MEENLTSGRGARTDEKEVFAACHLICIHNIWITNDIKTAVYNLKRAGMQALLGDLALASDETTSQHSIASTDFRVGVYTTEGDTPRLAANMFRPEQLEIMVDTIPAVVVRGVVLEDGADGLIMLAARFQIRLNDLRIHCRRHRVKAVVPENKMLMAIMIDADM